MIRRHWPAFTVAAAVLAAGLNLYAQPPAKSATPPPATPAPAAEPGVKELIDRQAAIERQYKAFTTNLLALAQKFEKSDRVEDKDKAKALRKAIDLADKEGVDNKFTVLLRTLGAAANNPSISDINSAKNQNDELIKALREILAILQSDDELARIKAEKDYLEKLLADLNNLIRQTSINQSRTDSGRGDPKQLAKDQKKLADAVDKLASKMGSPKAGEGKGGKPGEPKEGKPGEGKPGMGEPKPGGGMGEPKPGQPAPPKAPGADAVRKAVPDEENAASNLDENKRPKASDALAKAEEALKTARDELEKRLKQLREQELERILANLEARVNKMLQMQKEVLGQTVSIHTQIQKSAEKKPVAADFQNAQKQEDKEAEIISEADKAITLLQNEGSAVAFPAVFEEVRKDMARVKERLHDANVGEDTQSIEKDIIEALEHMRDALKKAQQELGNKPPGPPGDPNNDPQLKKLLDEIAELKMIRQLQVQVNTRTKRYGATEQAEDAQIKKELRDLSDRQEKIEVMINNMATKKNQ
jgi:hypothetical protein